MPLLYILDIVVMIPLVWAFALLWKQRTRFKTLVPIIIGIVFSFVARLCEVLVEHPSIYLFCSHFWDMSRESFDLTINLIGGFSDVLALLSLVIGFTQTIEYQLAKEKTIENLEKLLPICAGCKQYRTEDGTWYPIEKYIHDKSGTQMTHSICPACATKMREELRRFMEKKHDSF